ncbi:IPT/TIG domain-containing protein [Flagellimonas amoyensis]|uniref:IPT/TIG domain-containing protein n=1 Tax=Flagellimonas amoyensis TaxID=2169401 RepID=UPI000D397C79|nr:IPT/TIG domain-containing protein [Allomuricauda amoyensis]
MLGTKNLVLYTIVLFLCVNCSSDSSSGTEDPNTEIPDSSPEFTSLSKNSANFGETISIEGTNLDASENYIIKLDDTELTITEILSNEIKFEVPENAISGNISITFNGTSKVIGELLISLEFTGISKDYIEPGEEIEIYGTNINTTFDYSISINAVEANVKSITTSSFVLEFPLQASSGDILVSFNSTTLNASILSIKKVFEGNVLLSTQEEVDNFGNEGYTDITGWLGIGPEDTIPTDEIENVEKLVHIRNVETGVNILHNSALKNLHGLENLSYSGFLWFQVSDCASLTSLTELQIVFADIQSLIISRNENLEDLEGLNNIGTKVGSLFIIENDNLNNIEALSVDTPMFRTGFLQN